jgi:hypothetical protein
LGVLFSGVLLFCCLPYLASLCCPLIAAAADDTMPVLTQTIMQPPPRPEPIIIREVIEVPAPPPRRQLEWVLVDDRGMRVG